MCRWLVVVILMLPGFIDPPRARGQDDPELLKALALQKVMQRTILETESSIACILVSRSELYQRSEYIPGKLGTYNPKDPTQIKFDPTLSEKEREQKQRKMDLADPAHVPQAFGSGVVIDASGLILTNYHVVQDATKLYVRLPGGKGSYADIHAADPRSDLAVLKLIGTSSVPVAQILPLPAITFGDADKAARGQFVLTLANPFAAGFRDGQPSASWGILSSIRRRALHHLREEERVKPLHYYGTLLQIDARLHLGCSGGALLNLHGEMIGLLTSVAAIQGGETPGGYAIPINAGMRRIIEVLKRGEEVDYAFLGVGFDERTGPNGVTLSLVGRGSPADLEGKLKEGDTLLAVNGHPIHDSDDIFITIGTQLAGSKVKLLYRRGGQERTTVATLAKLYVPGKKIVSSLGGRPYFRGLRVDYTSLLAQQPPRLFSIPHGVYVSEVQRDSSADRVNLKSGDIITLVNQQPVNTPAAFYQAIANARGPVELTLFNFQPQDPPVRILLR